MRKLAAQVIALALCAALSLPALAQVVYIRDTLYVPLRGGQSTDHRILHRGLRSGTQLTVLDENPETKYSLVRTQDGLEGWLPTQYLTPEPVAQDQLDDARDRARAMESERDAANARVRQLELAGTNLQTQLEAALAAEASARNELDDLTRLAAGVIEVDEQNRALATSVTALNQEIDALHDANARLSDGTRRDWFLRGAGVVLAGLLVGFWLARRIYNRRNTGGWS